MKRAILLFAAAIMAFASCNKQEEPITIQFAKSQYVLQADAPLEISAVLSREASSALELPLLFAGTAELNKDYTVSAESFSFAAGSKSAKITVTPKDNYSADKVIAITFGALLPPAGYLWGENVAATVAVEAKEVLIYSFENAKSDVLEKNVVKVNITGLVAGSKWVASEDMDLPYKLEGEKDAVEVVEDAIKIKKGSSFGTLTVKAKDLEIGAESPVVKISVDAEKAGERFAAGTNASIELTVKGVLKISSILGTWEFGGIFGSDPSLEDEDALESWFFLEGDDPDLLPVHNDGFTLTFAEDKDKDGNVIGYKIVPGGEGDFNNFYRESSISWTAPIEDNLTTPGEIISDFCSNEYNMWVAFYDENMPDEELLTWFTLKANRNFDNSNENVADAAIAMRIGDDGNLVIHIKDYDQPPFGENWWSGYDPDMFAFASWFIKAE